MVGVALWPLFAWHKITIYPGLIHPRVMIEGFLTCFICGFLGTALPRLLDVTRFRLWETLLLAAGLVATTVFHLLGKTIAGDMSFLFTLTFLVGFLAVRFPSRKDNPPPAFVLVALGLTSGVAGTALQILLQTRSTLPVWAATLGKLLLNQGFILLPIMGIGAFLLPRFFNLPTKQNFPESTSLPPGWGKRAVFALGAGLVVISGFFLEAFGQTRWGAALRFLAVLLFFYKEVPTHLAKGGGSLSFALRVSLFSIPTGYLLIALRPERTFSFLHVLFITGFSLLTLTVASRVILGHSGQSSKFKLRLKSILALFWLLVLAMFTRVSADWMPAQQLAHYGYAALAWILGGLIWAIAILPSVRVADSE